MKLQERAREEFLKLISMPGPLGSDTLLSMLKVILRDELGFRGQLRGVDDFYKLTDCEAELAISSMPTLQIKPVDLDLPLGSSSKNNG